MSPKIATADTVDLPALRDFVRPRHHMVLTTFRADGALQSSPVTGGVDEQGRLVIASYPRRAKSVSIRRAGRASAAVLTRASHSESWCQISVFGPSSASDTANAGSMMSVTGRPSSTV
ncbi:hypothetical protein MSAR_17480 [Mycolicibacterium sarraceniae]|uniref:PPOX class F420-dependent oxidoreductase n=1 Tax=Mycolicibacterium sarraceniae TaxID=1534348 RepID=A0A7I7SNR2_9MYCO|nr:hypothetical protein MSAR_17480 [Mycolicibacterium sarraceniae]